MKKYLLLIVLGLFAGHANAQFPIKIPKISITKADNPRADTAARGAGTNPATVPTSANRTKTYGGMYDRHMVMDDAVTFFDAEPLKEYDTKNRGNIDVGWFLKSTLRILGTFPKRSAFRVAVKKNGKELSSVRCEGTVYTKDGDFNIRTPIRRAGRDLNYDDFMSSGYRCFDEKAVIKEIGELDVEIYFIDGDSDVEKLVRKHRIDVHKATKVRGNASAPQPDVADYYIQRHAESAVAVAYLVSSTSDGGSYFSKPVDNAGSPTFKKLFVYTTYSPEERRKMPVSPFTRCTVNGQKISLPDDKVRVFEDQGRREYGIYLDRLAPQFKTGPPYKDMVSFTGLTFQFPLYSGEAEYSKPPIKIEDHPGRWECAVVENGVTFRTFRWEVAGGDIVPHGEQRSGNINLYYKAALIDMEIPSGGSPLDHRLLPLPDRGLFYGIPWSTPEGRAMAGRVPKVGSPYHKPSTSK